LEPFHWRRLLGKAPCFPVAIGMLWARNPLSVTPPINAAAFMQAPAIMPFRMGDFARTLSKKDIAEIEAIAQASGGKPWAA
jgi:hypothetical protein